MVVLGGVERRCGWPAVFRAMTLGGMGRDGAGRGGTGMYGAILGCAGRVFAGGDEAGQSETRQRKAERGEAMPRRAARKFEQPARGGGAGLPASRLEQIPPLATPPGHPYLLPGVVGARTAWPRPRAGGRRCGDSSASSAEWTNGAEQSDGLFIRQQCSFFLLGHPPHYRLHAFPLARPGARRLTPPPFPSSFS